jgi:shikimate kinase
MNITLIGMAGVGKSYIGRLLAEKLNYKFIDVDEIIEKKANKKLQQIVDEDGENKLLKLEEEAVLDIGKVEDTVISPGGSVVYSEEAMRFLKNNSIIIFLNDSLENIKKNINNIENRGIIGLKNKSFEELFEERMMLYSRYADIVINISGLDVGKIVEEIMQQINLIL